MDLEREMAVRAAAISWLDKRPGEKVDFKYLSDFVFDGEPMPLLDRQKGIRKPRSLWAALSIRTTFTPPGQEPPYADLVGDDGFQRYKYRGNDPYHHENIALRHALTQKLPILWFIGISKGVFEPIYPVWVVGDEPESHQFVLAVDEAQRFLSRDAMAVDQRKYAERLTKARLHQRVFRAQVLNAYENRCCICKIRHTTLLDAAHIIEDGKPNGQPVVPNGLAMCKIHHAAFDANILGIRPDLSLHVRQDVLDEVDGWMLKGGIQGVHDKFLEVIPRQLSARPDPIRLEQKYKAFLGESPNRLQEWTHMS